MLLVQTEKNNITDNNKIKQLKQVLKHSDAVVIGAGAGLSTAAGFTYSGKRFEKYFRDFAEQYHFKDMYAGGFYPYRTRNEYWAYWSRYIYVNRYMNPPKPLYHTLYELVKDKDYFVITTNVDHCFQKAGFNKKRLFYTQGDYGLLQCSEPCHKGTYDNEELVLRMVKAQGYQQTAEKDLYLPVGVKAEMSVPDELVPYCPRCGKPMSMNLRADDTFVEDAGWYKAAERYEMFIEEHKDAKVLFLELGVGYNTPGIIKYPFWKMTNTWRDAVYACVNMGEAFVPEDIREKAICINGDISATMDDIISL